MEDIPVLDETLLYELCPVCQGDPDHCIFCFDEGVVIHDCDE